MSSETASGPSTAIAMGMVPLGTVVAFALQYAANVPPGWLLCDGSAIPPQYQGLITALGSNYTPNLTGRTLVGAGTGWLLASTGGEAEHALSAEEMPSHQHFGWGEKGGKDNWAGGGKSLGNSSSADFTGSAATDQDNHLYGSTYAGGRMTSVINTDNGSVAGSAPGTTVAHNNMQPYYVINYIIYAGS